MKSVMVSLAGNECGKEGIKGNSQMKKKQQPDRARITTYGEAEAYLCEVPKFTVKSAPEKTRIFYEFLNCPGEGRKIVHVAGTNGKGSVCTYLRNILTAHGKRTAVFTSPHLVCMRERFAVDGMMMGEDDFRDVFLRVSNALTQVQKISGMETYHPSFFEYLFFMAMLWFDMKNAEYIILETGMGGKLDATNVIRKPELCIITKIALDHMQYLGNTLEEIAGEKAGIIKEEVPLIFYDFDKTVTEILRNTAESKNAEAYGVENARISNDKNHKKYIDFCLDCSYYKGVCPQELQIKIPTVATYQMVNASLAVMASASLLGTGWHATVACNALATTVWPGRMEEIIPNLIVDGAHNEDGIEAFIRSLKACEMKDDILVFGVSSDKAYETMQKRLVTELSWSRIVVVPLRNDRSAYTDVLKKQFEAYTTVPVESKSGIREALDELEKLRSVKRIYVVGSLYLVGEVKELFMEE